MQAWALGAFEGSPTGVPGRRVLNIRQQILDEPPAALVGNVVGKGRDAGAGRTAHSCQGPRGPTFPELLSWYAASVGNVVGKGRDAGAGRTASAAAPRLVPVLQSGHPHPKHRKPPNPRATQNC